MAAPYPPPRVNTLILSGLTVVPEGVERAIIVLADVCRVRTAVEKETHDVQSP